MNKLKIDAKRFGWAGAITAAVLWTIYSITTFLLLITAIFLFSDIGYLDLFAFEYKPMLVKFILGLYILMLGAGFTGKMIADIYNFLIEKTDTKLP